MFWENAQSFAMHIWCFISDKNTMYSWLNPSLLYGKSHFMTAMTKPMEVIFCNLPGFCQSTLGKTIQWQNPDSMTFAINMASMPLYMWEMWDVTPVTDTRTDEQWKVVQYSVWAESAKKKSFCQNLPKFLFYVLSYLNIEERKRFGLQWVWWK